jgi:hypothetical protein
MDEMDIREVLFDFNNIMYKEETVTITLQERKIVISISATPFTYKVLVSVSIDGEYIVHNRVRTFREPFIGKQYLFKGDFYLIPKDDRDLEFRSDELRVRGMLVYADYREV